MRELVIVISDLHLPSDLEPLEHGVPWAAHCGAWPGIEHVARFAPSAALSGGWRGWVARWLDLQEYADYPAASVAAATAEVSGGTACWLATPLHLIEGLTRVHVDWGSVLRLSSEERERLAAGFKETFRGSGFDLTGLESGEFLLTAPPLRQVRTVEPARLLQLPMADALASGEGAGALRRLGTEIEMWLHAHPLNEARARQGEPPLSQLWIWGGGEAAAGAGGGAPPGAAAGQGHGAVVYGSDPYLAGLACLGGLGCAPLPPAQPLAPAGLEARALMALEVSAALRREPGWDLAEALAALDRSWIAAGLEALRSGTVARLTLLANDRLWRLARADRLRRWRRRRGGLGALA